MKQIAQIIQKFNITRHNMTNTIIINEQNIFYIYKFYY